MQLNFYLSYDIPFDRALTWNNRKKHTILMIVVVCIFLGHQKHIQYGSQMYNL